MLVLFTMKSSFESVWLLLSGAGTKAEPYLTLKSQERFWYFGYSKYLKLSGTCQTPLVSNTSEFLVYAMIFDKLFDSYIIFDNPYLP